MAQSNLLRLATAISLSVVFAHAAAGADTCRPGYAAAMVHDRGLAPRIAVVTGDFDNDGRPDVASLRRFGEDGTNARIGTVLLNRSNDAFDPKPLIGGGTFSSIHAVDLNKDGKLDLVAGGSVSVAVLLGNGDGTFTKKGDFAIPGVTSIASGDVNEDGRIDLVVTQGNPNQVTVLRGNGDGTLSTGNVIALQDPGQSVAVADFDRDGHLDLVIADRLTTAVYGGNGSGTFVRGSNLTAGVPPLVIGLADMNRDGLPDIIIGGQSGLSVFVNTGGRNFRVNGNYGLGNDARSVAIADLDRDGNLDVAAAGTGDIVVFRGTPDGLLAPNGIYVGGAGATAVAAGDFNGDGLPELAVANESSADVTVLRNVGKAQFDAMRKFDAGRGTNLIAVADVNQDGLPDTIVANEQSEDVAILTGNTTGWFTPGAGGLHLPFPAKVLRTGDFNADFAPDLAFLAKDGNAIYVVYGSATGGFGNAVTINLPNLAASLEVGDVSGDTRDDLLVFDADGKVHVYFADVLGGFSLQQNYVLSGGVTATTTADFNGDHRKDYAAADGSGVTLLLSTGSALAVQPSIFAPAMSYIAAGDLNHDGLLDIVGGGPNGIDILAGDASVGFVAIGHYSVPGKSVSSLAVADLDKDLDLDVVVTSFDETNSDNFITPFFNRGDAIFESGVALETEVHPGAVTIGDFNADGVVDLAFTAGGSLIVAQGECEPQRAALFASPNPATPGAPITLVGNALAGPGRDVTFTFREDGRVIGGAAATGEEPGVGRFVLSGLPQGKHHITVIAIYSNGTSSESLPIDVTVAPPVSQAPVRHRIAGH